MVKIEQLMNKLALTENERLDIFRMEVQETHREGHTVGDLFLLCIGQILKGNKDKHIQISCDDEGNGFHTLFYGFTEVTEGNFDDEDDYHDDVDLDNIIILG